MERVTKPAVTMVAAALLLTACETITGLRYRDWSCQEREVHENPDTANLADSITFKRCVKDESSGP